jgi:hypothetical protein
VRLERGRKRATMQKTQAIGHLNFYQEYSWI